MRVLLINGLSVEIDRRSARLKKHRREGRYRPFWRPHARQFFYDKMRAFGNPFILDVGANIGGFSLLAAGHPGAEIVAFEPNPVVYRALQKNVELNQLVGRVTALPYALTDTDGQDFLKVPVDRKHSGLACLGKPMRRQHKEGVTKVRVETRRLDSLNIGNVDLMKIDVEGCELLTLQGAEKTLRQWMPSIFVECTRKNTRQFGYKPAAVRKFLRQLGYRKFQKVGRSDWWIPSPYSLSRVRSGASMLSSKKTPSALGYV